VTHHIDICICTHTIHTHTHTHTLHPSSYTHNTHPPPYLSGGGTGGAKDPDWMRETATSESFLTEKADPPSLAGAHTTITNAQFSLDLANLT
jgi:hypothetical protein